VSFESGEHIAIGDLVKLQLNEKIPGEAGIKLKLPNGLELTYGEIVALGGDFYANSEQPISFGATDPERKRRFQEAYNSLAVDIQAFSEAPQILAVMQDEAKQLAKGIQQGEKIPDIYRRIEKTHTMAFNCVTGGLCQKDYPEMSEDTFRQIYFLQPGRYLKIIDRNFDHFSQNAWIAYSSGHTLALEMAVQAKLENNLEKLTTAYAINAFSSHYLSDGFSSGHMRTPRVLLFNMINPSFIGTFLAVYMHNEDCENGLHVSNQRGDNWLALGDKYYLDERNKKNREILLEAMQLSADEVFSAYQHGSMPEKDTVEALMPNLSKPFDAEDRSNPSPLFYWDNKQGKLLRRADVTDITRYEWTPYWYGWSTLADLTEAKGSLLY